MEIVVAGGQENISALNGPFVEWVGREQDDAVMAISPHAYMPMLQTAEFVAKKYKISREQQDHYALQSQQRTALRRRRAASMRKSFRSQRGWRCWDKADWYDVISGHLAHQGRRKSNLIRPGTASRV